MLFVLAFAFIVLSAITSDEDPLFSVAMAIAALVATFSAVVNLG
jgi:hypothetical protein